MFLSVAIIGIVAGGLASALWYVSARWFADSTFWASVQQLAVGLVNNNIDEFFVEYLRLLRGLGNYLVKTSCRVAITIAPIALTLTCFSPIMARWQLQQASGLIVHPPQRVSLRSPTTTSPQQGTPLYPWHADGNENVILATEDWQQTIPVVYPTVITSSQRTATLYQLCGFQVRHDAAGPSLLLLRTAADERNPFWPYLNDLEFIFWVSLLGASVGTSFSCHRLPRLRQVGIPSPAAGAFPQQLGT